jgi:hypothetical protein
MSAMRGHFTVLPSALYPPARELFELVDSHPPQPIFKQHPRSRSRLRRAPNPLAATGSARRSPSHRHRRRLAARRVCFGPASSPSAAPPWPTPLRASHLPTSVSPRAPSERRTAGPRSSYSPPRRCFYSWAGLPPTHTRAAPSSCLRPRLSATRDTPVLPEGRARREGTWRSGQNG